MNKKKLNELKVFAREMTKPIKWERNYISEEKGAKLKLHTPNERITNVFAHEWFRDIYLVSGIPLPEHLRYKWLFTNHSRKKIKRK